MWTVQEVVLFLLSRNFVNFVGTAWSFELKIGSTVKVMVVEYAEIESQQLQGVTIKPQKREFTLSTGQNPNQRCSKYGSGAPTWSIEDGLCSEYEKWKKKVEKR
jgi:hypothetical protein